MRQTLSITYVNADGQVFEMGTGFEGLRDTARAEKCLADFLAFAKHRVVAYVTSDVARHEAVCPECGYHEHAATCRAPHAPPPGWRCVIGGEWLYSPDGLSYDQAWRSVPVVSRRQRGFAIWKPEMGKTDNDHRCFLPTEYDSMHEAMRVVRGLDTIEELWTK